MRKIIESPISPGLSQELKNVHGIRGVSGVYYFPVRWWHELFGDGETVDALLSDGRWKVCVAFDMDQEDGDESDGVRKIRWIYVPHSAMRPNGPAMAIRPGKLQAAAAKARAAAYSSGYSGFRLMSGLSRAEKLYHDCLKVSGQ